MKMLVVSRTLEVVYREVDVSGKTPKELRAILRHLQESIDDRLYYVDASECLSAMELED